MRCLIFLISLLLFGISGNYCIAFEPPSFLVEDAIKKGEIAFIGRIVKLEEIADGEYESTALAEVNIIQTFYGISVNKGATVKIKYHSRVFSDIPHPGFSADFHISDVILFVFNNRQDLKSDILYFNSYWNNPSVPNLKIDLAYYAFDDPNERYTKQRIEHAFVSIYMPGCHSRLKLNNFFKLIEKRKNELKGNN